MKTDLFDYHLPEGQIAQRSVEPRDHSRLMVLDRQTGVWQHKRFLEIGEELRSGDVLVFNDTKVFRARMRGQVEKDGEAVKAVEVFLLRAMEGNVWEVLIRPGRKIRVGDHILFPTYVDYFVRSQKAVNILSGTVREKRDDGVMLVEFDRSSDQVIAYANAHGEIPVPPYVKELPTALEQYQTIYARQTGSVAAPTAGFHFTTRLLDELKTKGVQFEFVTLHVGLGTFRPVKTETLEEHEMHSEFVSLDAQTAQRINRAKQEGRRIIAVGTTTVRTLEGIASLPPFQGGMKGGFLRPYAGDVHLFIKPGFEFRVIDGLITNFHLPKSTLLVLVSAFAGRERILSAYEEAIRHGYRFFSFGDVMFIR